MRRWSMRPALLLALGCLAACGSGSHSTVDGPIDCSAEKRAETFVVGLEHKGDAGKIDFKLMSSDPSPPARGFNTWVVQVNTMTGGVVGSPITGAQLVTTCVMPDHGHGCTNQVLVTAGMSP